MIEKSLHCSHAIQILQYVIIVKIFFQVGYQFKVYPVHICPGNKTAFETAAEKLNCTGRYLCAPNKDLTNLIEFCTDRQRSLFLQGIFYITHSLSAPTLPFIRYSIDLKGLLHHNNIYKCTTRFILNMGNEKLFQSIQW